MRKRLLVYETTRKDANAEIWSMRFRGREDKLDMVNPRLDESQVAEVTLVLKRMSRRRSWRSATKPR